MVRHWLYVILILWGGALVAQDDSVRSGEHETFTRLVLPIPVDAEWTLRRGPDRYVFSIVNGQQQFDIAQVFDRIPRTRIADLQTMQDGAALAIVTSCTNCYADAFLWRPDRVVIDVVDGIAPADSEFEVAPDAPRPRPSEDAPTPVALPLLAGSISPPAVPLAPKETPSIDITATERALLESLARASSQGVIEIASQLQTRSVPTSEPEMDEVGVTEPVVTPDSNVDAVPTDGQPGISMRTSFDQAFPHITTTPLSDQGETCLGAEVFDLAAWSETGIFNLDIGAQRTALTEEFDRVPPNAPEDLARSYIYYGFGREALQALALDGIRSKSREVLAEMAIVVDGGTVPNGLLSAQLGCDGSGALWAALAVESLADKPVGIDRNSVLLAHRSLPEGLRGHLGTTLAARFLDIDDADSAAMILQASEQAITGNDADTTLVAADIAQRDGDDDAAIARLRDATGASGRVTPKGLMELIDLTIEQNQGFDQATLELIAALRFELRNSDIAVDLGVAHARALGHSGMILPALAVIDEISPDVDRETQVALQSDLTMRAVSTMSDAAFLAFAFEDMIPDVDAQTENAAAARLLALGFPDRAAQLLLADASRDAMRERRYLRASAYIALEKPEDALQEIAGMTDPRASRLRADALIARGDLGGALAAHQGAAQEDEPDTDLAWRAGAWARLSDDSDPLLRDVSRRMLGETEPPVPDSPLAQREQLLLNSGETRALVQDLLDRFPIEQGDLAQPMN